MREIQCDSICSNTATYFLMAKFSQIVYHINVYHPKKSQDKPMRIDGVFLEVCHIMIVCHMTVHDGNYLNTDYIIFLRSMQGKYNRQRPEKSKDYYFRGSKVVQRIMSL